MKKLSFMLLSLLAVTMFTSCGDDDEPVNKQTITASFNCRAYDGNEVVFSQNTGKVELNYTDMTIQITTNCKDTDGTTHVLTSGVMSMEHRSGYLYSFRESTGLSSSSGYIDLSTGMMWLTFIPEDGTTAYYCTSHLVYNNTIAYYYTTTHITNPDNGFNYNHEKSAYLFIPNAKAETCTMVIFNFMPNTAGSIEVSEIQYDELQMTVTPDGYTITASEVEPTNYKGTYIISDLNFTLYNQASNINGTFKCNDLEFKVTGDLFPAN